MVILPKNQSNQYMHHLFQLFSPFPINIHSKRKNKPDFDFDNVFQRDKTNAHTVNAYYLYKNYLLFLLRNSPFTIISIENLQPKGMIKPHVSSLIKSQLILFLFVYRIIIALRHGEAQRYLSAQHFCCFTSKPKV